MKVDEIKESVNVNGYCAYIMNNYVIPYGGEAVKWIEIM